MMKPKNLFVFIFISVNKCSTHYAAPPFPRSSPSFTGTSIDTSTPSTPANSAVASKRPAILPHKFFACQAVR